MKERPILFSAPMVRALLNGSKTQTRRVVKPQPPKMFCSGDVAAITNGTRWAFSRLPERLAHPPGKEPGILCPYGQPGDRLWVRETLDHDAGRGHFYKATGMYVGPLVDYEKEPPPSIGLPCRAISSIHMPRWASRITLEITGVRVERLQEISRGDATAEGCPFPNMAKGDDPRQWYTALWGQINGEGSWEANPWVWVVEFKKVTP
jgi:hypothetical protein